MYRIFFVLVFAFILGISGCSFLNLFQGNFQTNDWEIEGIFVRDKVYLSPEWLVLESKNRLYDRSEDLQESQEDFSSESKESEVSKNSAKKDLHADLKGHIDMDAKDFEQLARMNYSSVWSFDPKQKKIFGNTGCNQFSASYSWRDADRIVIYDVTTTRKVCSPSSVMAFELNLVEGISGVFFVEKTSKDFMILKGEHVKVYLNAKKDSVRNN